MINALLVILFSFVKPSLAQLEANFDLERIPYCGELTKSTTELDTYYDKNGIRYKQIYPLIFLAEGGVRVGNGTDDYLCTSVKK